MFCPNCGTSNEDGALFCGSCGNKLEVITAAAPSQAEMAQPEASQQTAQPVYAETSQQAAQPVYDQTQQAAQPVYGQTQQAAQPVYDQTQQAAQPVYGQPQQTYAQPQAPKQKVAISPLLFVAIGELVVFIILVAVFVSIGKKTYGCDVVAEAYADAYLKGDFEQAYSMLDVEESNLLTQASFVAAHQYDSTEAKSLSVKYSDVDEDTAEVTMSYRDEWDEKQELVVNLEKAGKKFLFFDTWKVVLDDDAYAEDYTVYVLKDSVLYMDGNKVSTKFIEDEEEGNFDTYKLDKVYSGYHNFYAVVGDYTTEVEKVNVYSESYDYVTEICLNQEQQEEMIQLAYEIQNATLDSLMGSDGFDAIKDYYAEDEQDSAQSSYAYSQDDFAGYYTPGSQDDSYVYDVQLSNISGEVYDVDFDSWEDALYCSVEISYDYVDSYWYNYNGWFFDDHYKSTYEGTGLDTYNFYYVDGQWKLYNFSTPDYTWY